jgi:hypothetical protein
MAAFGALPTFVSMASDNSVGWAIRAPAKAHRRRSSRLDLYCLGGKAALIGKQFGRNLYKNV